MANNFVKTITVNGETYDIRSEAKVYLLHSSGYLLEDDGTYSNMVPGSVVVAEYDAGIPIKIKVMERESYNILATQDMLGWSTDGSYYYTPIYESNVDDYEPCLVKREISALNY